MPSTYTLQLPKDWPRAYNRKALTDGFQKPFRMTYVTTDVTTPFGEMARGRLITRICQFASEWRVYERIDTSILKLVQDPRNKGRYWYTEIDTNRICAFINSSPAWGRLVDPKGVILRLQFELDRSVMDFDHCMKRGY